MSAAGITVPSAMEFTAPMSAEFVDRADQQLAAAGFDKAIRAAVLAQPVLRCGGGGAQHVRA